ncbi:MAG: histidine--tRNA ligase [Polyangiaceae bacterium]|nr:histidine--tRNA ligase [Polyangiaceae bacterium]
MSYRAVKGMNDILPDEVARWHALERAFRETAELHGYAEIRTPVVEGTELFVRSIGETTDVVEKEMYTFSHHSESLTLRPEGTAGAARAYVEHKAHAKEPVSRWFYLGPMFRAERPQRGRYRQFYQAGCEIFGDPGPACDAEMIDMLVGLFRRLGVSDVVANIGSIGGAATRDRYRVALREFLSPKAGELSDHARARLEVNPLRILDSKDPRDQAACQGAPQILDVLDEADRAHWETLLGHLDALGTPYVVDPLLVRGLDYYTRTLFELKSSAGELGSQNTLCGGGRYDDMIRGLGGPSVPAIGFAMGLERILLALGPMAAPARKTCSIAPMGTRAVGKALELGRALREAGVVADVDGRGNSLKSMLRRADGLGARFCIVLGDAELERGAVQLKDLERHTQEELPISAVVARVAGGGA